MTLPLKQKISKELLPIAWQPKKWCNFCMAEDEEKSKTDRPNQKIEPIFTE